MSKSKFPKEILEKAKTITGKRSRVVVDHILKHGSITTEDLENYGYKHPLMRRLDIVWEGKEVADYQAVANAAEENEEPMPEYVKRVLRQAFGKEEK